MNKLLWLTCGLVLLLTACATSGVVATWKDKTKTGKLNRVFVLAVVKEPAYRQLIEYGIVNILNEDRLRAIPTIDSFPGIGEIDKVAASDLIKEFGIDSVLLVRLVDRKVEQTYVEGTYYSDAYYRNRYATGWRNYYGAGFHGFETPGYVTSEYVNTVETAIFDLETDQIRWTALTETPGTEIKPAIESYLQTIGKALAASKLF
jgi:hypothetical protein